MTYADLDYRGLESLLKDGIPDSGNVNSKLPDENRLEKGAESLLSNVIRVFRAILACTAVLLVRLFLKISTIFPRLILKNVPDAGHVLTIVPDWPYLL